MAAIRHFEFAKFWYFVKSPTLEAQAASAYQISFKSDYFKKSDDSRLKSDYFKMAAVRHLEFFKFGILVI